MGCTCGSRSAECQTRMHIPHATAAPQPPPPVRLQRRAWAPRLLPRLAPQVPFRPVELDHLSALGECRGQGSGLGFRAQGPRGRSATPVSIMLTALACATVPGAVARTVRICVNPEIDFWPPGLAGSLPLLQTEHRAHPLLFLLPGACTDPKWQASRAMQHALVAVAPLTVRVDRKPGP